MKRLICAKDMEALAQQGEKVFYTDNNTIITPAARDAAQLYGIEITHQIAQQETCCPPKASEPDSAEIDTDMIYKVLKAMWDKGLLKGIIDNVLHDKYVAERGSGGLKIVRGQTVKFDPFDTGNPNNKVFCQELIHKDESKMSAGFLTMEKSCFEWELSYEEIDYVIEGTLTLTINGKTYTAYPGDVIYLPSGSKVVWSTNDKAKIFYTTYPANWADLKQC